MFCGIVGFSKDFMFFRLMEMGCCGCFGFLRRYKVIVRFKFGFYGFISRLLQQYLLDEEIEVEDDDFYNGEVIGMI